MKQVRGRRAQFSFGYTFLFIVIFAVFLLFYTSMLRVFVDTRSPMPENFYADLAHANIVNNCFVYKNPVGDESITNVLDERKLTLENLKSCFKTSSKDYFPIKVTITSERTKPVILSVNGNRNGEISEHLCLLKLSETNETIMCNIKVET